MNNPSLIIDIFLIVILIIAALKGYINGFFAAIVELLGKFAALFAAFFASRHFSRVIFEKLRPRLVERAYNYLIRAVQSVDVSTALKDIIGGWSTGYIEGILTDAREGLGRLLQPDMESAVYLVDDFIGPIVTGLMGVIIFILVFIVVVVICSVLIKLLKVVNEVPILGDANQLLGLLVGAAGGLVNIIILSFLLSIIVIGTGDSLPFVNAGVLAGSKILGITGFINPFLP